MEYASVRIIVLPVAVWLNTAKSASSSSLALLTGIEKLSMSPAGDAGVATMSFSVSHALTAATVSGLGATNALT